MKSDLSVAIYKDLSNKNLITHWKRIQENSDVYPQMYYEWCEPWWQYRSKGRELHIITVVENNDKIVGIAPLCIEKKIGLRILKSFPIHFGDFYSFIIDKSVDFLLVFSLIIRHIKTFKHWSFVHLLKINNNTILFKKLNKDSFASKELVKNHIVLFSNTSFEDYLKTISHNARQQFRKRLRRLERKGEVSLTLSYAANDYIASIGGLKKIYESRWAENSRKHPSDSYYQLLNEVIDELGRQGKFMLFFLFLDGQIIAYRWGVCHDDIYYDWKVGHNTNYDQFSPGMISIGLVIKKLIQLGYKKLSFGAGDYDWKRRWATPEAESANYEFFLTGNSLKAKLYLNYCMRWKDYLKTIYTKLLQFSWFRRINRKIRAPK